MKIKKQRKTKTTPTKLMMDIVFGEADVQTRPGHHFSAHFLWGKVKR